MNQTPVESQPTRFSHSCRDCGGRFNVLIQTGVHRVHQAACPHCGRKNFFDNRRGQLERAAQPVRPPESRAERVPDRSRPRSPEPSRAGSSPQTTPRKPAAPRPTSFRTETNRDYAGQRSPGSSQPAARRGNGRPTSQTERGLKILTRPPGSPKGWRDRLDRGLQSLPDFGDWRGTVDYAGDLLRQRGLLLLIPAAALGFGMILLVFLSLQLPGLYLAHDTDFYMDRLEVVRPNRVLDRNGELLAELFSRRTGNLDETTIPETLATALVFTEDQNFYSHGGVHWPSIFRAFLANIFSGGYSQGGSTITQQLARILLDDREKSIFRKLKETSLAYHLEASLTKKQILAGYMNHVYLGHGARGFETAADFYFDKKVGDLTFEERLALVCLPSAPARYSPLRNPDRLRAKMDAVYERMIAAGLPGVPEPTAYAKDADDMLRSLSGSPGGSVFGDRVNEAPYVAEYVRQEIKKLLGDEYEFGAGLNVRTTIDRKLQLAAVEESRKWIRTKAPAFPATRMKDGKRLPVSTEEKMLRDYGDMALGPALFGIPAPPESRPRLQTASVGIENKTGGILFLQGGAEFASGNQLNRAIQMRRQTGSAVKPFVYSAGIESGAVTAGTLLDDRPIFVSLKNIAHNQKKDYWLPGNYSGVFEGEILVRRALEKSQNIPAIRVADRTGLDRLGEQFRKFFFYKDAEYERRFRKDATVAIGSLEMSPLEIATAFTGFANNGVIRRPFLIQRIEDADGKTLWSPSQNHDEFSLGVPVERTVLPGDVSEIMVSLLRSSAKYGGVGGLGGVDYIGKTGTSNEYRDAWFVGATPGVTAAVWLGFDEPAYSMPGGTGAGLAGPLWGRIMSKAPRLESSFRFSPNAVSMKICKTTGRKPGPNCPTVVTELFRPNFPPEDPEPATNASDDPETKPSNQDKPDPADWSINSDSDFE